MYENVKEHVAQQKGAGTSKGNELLHLDPVPAHNYAANTYLTALAYIAELEANLRATKSETNTSLHMAANLWKAAERKHKLEKKIRVQLEKALTLIMEVHPTRNTKEAYAEAVREIASAALKGEG